MRRRRRTLARMDLQRILTDVLDVIVSQGGDLEAVEAILWERYPEANEAADVAAYSAAAFLAVFTAPGGPALLRGLRDQRRELERYAATLAPPARSGWGRRAG